MTLLGPKGPFSQYVPDNSILSHQPQMTWKDLNRDVEHKAGEK